MVEIGDRGADQVVPGSIFYSTSPKSPCTIPGGRASRRAKQSGSDGASPSRNHERPFRGFLASSRMIQFVQVSR